MIMPANYSVIAENELSYVDGGFVEPLTSVTTLQDNIVKYIGNLYSYQVMNAFIGQWFADDGDANVFSNVFSSIGNLFTGEKKLGGAKNDVIVGGQINVKDAGTTAGKVLAGIRNTIGVLGGIYVLGRYSDAVKVKDIGSIAPIAYNTL